MNIKAIIEHLDIYLTRTGRPNIDPVEANSILEKAGLLSLGCHWTWVSKENSKDTRKRN